MKAFCDSVILEEPPEPTNVFRVALAVTDFSGGEGVRLDDHIRRDRAVRYSHPLARVLSQNRLVVEEEEEKSGRYPACAHFSKHVSTNTSVWLVILSLWSQVLKCISKDSEAKQIYCGSISVRIKESSAAMKSLNAAICSCHT